jgi:hypothetical protein
LTGRDNLLTVWDSAHPVGWASVRQAVVVSRDQRRKERPVDEVGTARRPLPGLTEPHINPSSAERARLKSKRHKELERAGRIPAYDTLPSHRVYPCNHKGLSGFVSNAALWVRSQACH